MGDKLGRQIMRGPVMRTILAFAGRTVLQFLLPCQCMGASGSCQALHLGVNEEGLLNACRTPTSSVMRHHARTHCPLLHTARPFLCMLSCQRSEKQFSFHPSLQLVSQPRAWADKILQGHAGVPTCVAMNAPAVVVNWTENDLQKDDDLVFAKDIDWIAAMAYL